MGAFVGIDLGTTFSVIAYVNQDGRAEVIPNHLGELITPSVIDLGQQPPLVGTEAKEKQQFGDESVYAFFKRDMGNPNVLYIEGGRRYTPIDLSSMVLRYLKECAEAYLKQPVTDAVITVPAYFGNLQRLDTIEAGRMAGLNVLRIISEPTAAALAYGVRPSTQTAKVLVYDLGGGTFDVSLVEITSTHLNVIATNGDHELGGKDWDDVILRWLSSKFEQEIGFEVPDSDLAALAVQAEDTKKALSSKTSARISVQAGGKTGVYDMTRQEFESLTQALLRRTQGLVEQTLADAKLTWQDLLGVVLVGGSTKMPMVREYVQNMSGKPPMMGVDADQAVGVGAAIQAALDIGEKNNNALSLGGRPKAPSELVLGGRKTVDVISSSLGLIAENDDRTKYINSLIIRKNQAIPCQQTRPYQLRVSRRNENKLEVFMTQAESSDPVHCKYLGKYVFSEIPEIASQVAVIDITYAYNVNGVVEVSAVERSTQKSLKLTIEPLPTDVPHRFTLPPPAEKVREHLTLYMAFDLSGSMSGKPLLEAQKAAHKFLSQIDLTSASLGIIEFSDRIQTTVHACQNAQQIAQGIDSLKIGRTGHGNDTDPFGEIYGQLHRTKGLRYGLVLTDGVWEDQGQAIRQARRCHQDKMEIIAVGFGGADEKFLRQISSSDEYSFFTNMNELSDVFGSIAQELTESGGEMKADSMKQRRKGLRLF